MSNHESIRKLCLSIPLFIALVFLFIIPSTAILISNNSRFGTTNLVYGQSDQMNSNITNSLNIQNMPIKKVHVGDIDIAYKVFGIGDPFLLISGSGLTMDAWEPSILKEFSSNHTVIIYDNRGVGNTTIGTKPFSIQQFANDTVGLLDALKIQKADVLGFSMASFIAQEITLLHPEKVNRLILYGATCGGKENIPQTPQVVKILSDLVNNRTQDPEKILSVTFPLEWVKSHPNSTIPESKEIVTSNTLKQQFNLNEGWLATNWGGVCSQLTKISKPTLVITGTEDVAVPAANSLILAQKIPGAWLVQIKGGGHGLMYQYPDIFNKVLQTFLSTRTNPG
jgi:pimeloyl-ACP methyl ester carboxylesterase